MKDSKGPIFIATDAPSSDAIADLPTSWMTDALVVAFVRSAMARKIRLAVPFQDAIGPLVAQVAAEYITPQLAEDVEREMSPEPRSSESARISFFTVGATQKGTRSARPSWMGTFGRLGMVDDQVLPLRAAILRMRPIAVVAIGAGRKIEAILAEARNAQVPIYDLASTVARGARKSRSVDWRETLERELIAQREKLRFFRPRLGDQSAAFEERQKIEPPAYFRLVPPLVLYAQALLSAVLDGQSD